MPRSMVVRPHRTQRRRTAWSRARVVNQSLVSGTAVAVNVLSPLVNNMGLTRPVGFTILRTILYMQALGSNTTCTVRGGLIVNHDNATPASTAGPINQPDLDWYGIVDQFIGNSVATIGTTQGSNNQLYEFKSRRRLTDVGDQAFFVMEADSSVSVLASIHTLVALP